MDGELAFETHLDRRLDGLDIAHGAFWVDGLHGDFRLRYGGWCGVRLVFAEEDGERTEGVSLGQDFLSLRVSVHFVGVRRVREIAAASFSSWFVVRSL